MEFIFFIIIAIVIICIFCAGYSSSGKRLREKTEREKKREQEREKNEIEWNNILLEREKEFGKLTKKIVFDSAKSSIDVYNETQTIFIYNKQYSFFDFLTCSIEKEIEYGRETHVTKPDKFDLAEKQLLYGMGKNYNVKQITTVTKDPDFITHIVQIGLKDIATPLLTLRLKNKQRVANEINALINAVIHTNKPQ